MTNRSGSSASFTAEMKDFIAPLTASISNCGGIEGKKVTDLTGNGLSADDTPLGGVTISLFKDANGNDTLDGPDGAAEQVLGVQRLAGLGPAPGVP